MSGRLLLSLKMDDWHSLCTADWHSLWTADWHSLCTADWHSLCMADWHSLCTADWHSLCTDDWYPVSNIIESNLYVRLRQRKECHYNQTIDISRANLNTVTTKK